MEHEQDKSNEAQSGQLRQADVSHRAIRVRFGTPEMIQVPVEWKEAKGIEASYRETNASLAQRNYGCKCETGTEPLIVVEGYWIWWCKTHHQPLPWCERAKASSHGG